MAGPSTAAALGDVGRGAAFARVDDFAGEQSVPSPGEPDSFRERFEMAEQRFVEMGFRPVEADPGDLESELAQPIRVALEQFRERCRPILLDRFPRIGCHRRAS